MLRSELLDLVDTVAIRLARKGVDIDVPPLNEISALPVAEIGNFTVATVHVGGRAFTGVAKRNPKDVPNPLIGERLAIVRALRRAFTNAAFRRN